MKIKEILRNQSFLKEKDLFPERFGASAHRSDPKPPISEPLCLMVRLGLLFIAAVVFSGCVVPGSGMGRVAISGMMDGVDFNEERVTLEITLPKNYGLGGLDLVLNTPEDFGNKDQIVTVEVRDGFFSYEFPPVVYHVSVWLIPPLGAFPKKPPPPFYVILISDSPNEIYLAGMDGEAFRYDVYDRTSREKMKPEEGTWKMTEGEYVPLETEEGEEVWHLRISLAKQNGGQKAMPKNDTGFEIH